MGQVLTYQGDYNYVWQTVSSGGTTIPSFGSVGQVLTYDASGSYFWRRQVPTGGNMGQVLTYQGDYNYVWQTVSSGSGGSLPASTAAGQVLTSTANSTSPQWSTITTTALPASTAAGQVLTSTSDSNVFQWTTVSSGGGSSGLVGNTRSDQITLTLGSNFYYNSFTITPTSATSSYMLDCTVYLNLSNTNATSIYISFVSAPASSGLNDSSTYNLASHRTIFNLSPGVNSTTPLATYSIGSKGNGLTNAMTLPVRFTYTPGLNLFDSSSALQVCPVILVTSGANTITSAYIRFTIAKVF